MAAEHIEHVCCGREKYIYIYMNMLRLHLGFRCFQECNYLLKLCSFCFLFHCGDGFLNVFSDTKISDGIGNATLFLLYAVDPSFSPLALKST